MFSPEKSNGPGRMNKKTQHMHIALCEIMILLRRLQNKFTNAPVSYAIYILFYLCR